MAQTYDPIIEFYGETCPHCITMKPIVEELEKELGGEFTKLETWNDPKNAEKMAEYSGIIGEACGGFAGVPSFVNTQTNQALCGAQDKEILRQFAEGADCKDGVCQPHTKMPAKA